MKYLLFVALTYARARLCYEQRVRPCVCQSARHMLVLSPN